MLWFIQFSLRTSQIYLAVPNIGKHYSPFLFQQPQTSNWFALCVSKTGLVSWKEDIYEKSQRSQRLSSDQPLEMASHIWQQAFTLSHIRLYPKFNNHGELFCSSNVITCFCVYKVKKNLLPSRPQNYWNVYFSWGCTILDKTDYNTIKQEAMKYATKKHCQTNTDHNSVYNRWINTSGHI